MNYKDFQEALLEQIKKDVPLESGNLSLVQTIQSNGMTLPGLKVIVDDTKEIIYGLDYYHDLFLNGYSLASVSDLLLADMEKRQDIAKRIGVLELKQDDYSGLEFHICSKEGNRSYLKNLPYTDLGTGLVATYHLRGVFGEDSSVTITNELFSMMDISKDELHSKALMNTEKKHPATFEGMEAVLDGMLDPVHQSPLLSIDMAKPESEMVVLTNRDRREGAAVLFYPGVQETIRYVMNKDYYVLPSSRHEVLIVPADDGRNPEELRMIVREINATQVDKEDRLSNEVYLYDHKEKELVLAVVDNPIEMRPRHTAPRHLN